jgi:hypothetical protein
MTGDGINNIHVELSLTEPSMPERFFVSLWSRFEIREESDIAFRGSM